MKCQYCGTETRGTEKFCIFCGTKLNPISEQIQLPKVGQPTPSAQPDEPEQIPAVYPLEQPGPVAQPMQKAAEEAIMPAPKRRTPPAIQLPEGRGLVKMIFLGLITLGIYPAVIYSRIVTEVNILGSRYDGLRTMPYFAMLTLAPITLGILPLVWTHRFTRRIKVLLQHRRIDYKFGPADFWLWNILGSLIIVGPFIYVHKLMKSMNLLNAHFNING